MRIEETETVRVVQPKWPPLGEPAEEKSTSVKIHKPDPADEAAAHRARGIDQILTHADAAAAEIEALAAWLPGNDPELERAVKHLGRIIERHELARDGRI